MAEILSVAYPHGLFVLSVTYFETGAFFVSKFDVFC